MKTVMLTARNNQGAVVRLQGTTTEEVIKKFLNRFDPKGFQVEIWDLLDHKPLQTWSWVTLVARNSQGAIMTFSGRTKMEAFEEFEKSGYSTTGWDITYYFDEMGRN